MSKTLSGLYLRERAVWIQPSRAFLPAGAAAKPPQVQRPKLLYKKRIGATFRRALWRSGCCHRSTVSAALPTPAGPGVQAVEEPVKRTPVDSSVLIQGFGWTSCDQQDWYDQIKLKVPELKEAGFTHIWLPPPSQSVSRQGYLPAQLYNLESCYGNKEQLQSLTWALNYAGIKPVADIVINHRCADVQNAEGIWNSYRDDVHHHGRRIDWGSWAVCRDDWHFGGTGALKTGASYHPAPDLDHTNDELRAALKDWLLWLRHEMGFMGWRFDFVKGYAPKYVKEYVDASIVEDSLHVAEFWVDMRWFGNTMDYDQDAPRQVLCDWITNSGGGVAAFDFPTKGILQEAVRYTQYDRLRDRSGGASGLLGWWPQKACTFIDNHDTGSSQQHWPFPESHIGLGYAYILTHPGLPCVAWEHMWDPRHTFIITQLMAMRRRQDIHAGSKLEILCADRMMYVARVDNRVVIKLGPQHDMGTLLPVPSQGWRLCITGHDFAVWEKGLMELPSASAGPDGSTSNIVSFDHKPTNP